MTTQGNTPDEALAKLRAEWAATAQPSGGDVAHSVDGLREQVAEALLASWGKHSPSPADLAEALRDADAVLAMVGPWLDALTAKHPHTDNIGRDGGSFVLRRAVAREHWAEALTIVREVAATLPAEPATDQGDPAGPCPKCGSDQTHVSFEDATAAYCRTCRKYWREPTQPEAAIRAAAWDEGFAAGVSSPANRMLGLGNPKNPYRAAAIEEQAR